jgi:glucan phosphoethanolaminetransferase (alkaline phosphatase superfamily)
MRRLPRSHSLPAALVLLALLCACACARESGPSFVLVTLDTTRADHLGLYGYERGRTPHLDRFAERARVYLARRRPSAAG